MCIRDRYPIRTDYQTPAGACLFLLPKASLSRFLDAKMGKYGAATYVLDADGTLLFSSGELDGLTADSLALSTPEGRTVVNGTEYQASSVSSAQWGWR